MVLAEAYTYPCMGWAVFVERLMLLWGSIFGMGVAADAKNVPIPRFPSLCRRKYSVESRLG